MVYEDQARAVIEALREPTEAMIAAGEDCPIVNYDGNDPKQVWQAMIDAALKEPDGADESRPSPQSNTVTGRFLLP